MIFIPINSGWYRLVGLLCCLGLPYWGWAQLQLPEICGTTMSQEGYKQYRKDAQKERRFQYKNAQTTTTLKLQPHIIRRSNGTGGLNPLDLALSIQQLNQAFAPVGFSFVDCDPNYIDNDDFYNEIILTLDTTVNSLEYDMALSNRVADAINVFFVPNGVDKVGGTAQINWSSFPYMEQSLNKDWIVMTNSFAVDNETLAHEVGHYFNLLHTHFNSDLENLLFDGQDIDQENVTRNPADPCYNCETAGDLICDTEASIDLSFRVDSMCQYTTPTINNTCANRLYTPDTRNIMSYALINRQSIGCRINFSPGQINRMWNALNQFRTNLSSNCSDCPANVTVIQDVLNGQVGVVTASNSITAINTIQSGGTATYDAGVEIVLTPNFNALLGANFDGVINGCTAPVVPPPAPSNSTTNVAVTASMGLAPNPATEQVTLTFTLPAERAVAHIVLVNAQGQQVQEALPQQALSKGTYQVAISTLELPAGLYFVQLLTEQETITKQLVVLNQ